MTLTGLMNNLEESKSNLEAHELLDRFEFLHDEVDELKDLRRAILDKDLSSIFRLVGSITRSKLLYEELRKAVIEDNEHAIFRCAKANEIKKVVLDDNLHSLYRVFDKFKKTNITTGLRRCTNEDIWFDPDCLSRGQIKSKLWLINELKNLDLDEFVDSNMSQLFPDLVENYNTYKNDL